MRKWTKESALAYIEKAKEHGLTLSKLQQV